MSNWDNLALSAFQDKNLNHYFTANPNGRDICLDFDAIETTDAQKQTSHSQNTNDEVACKMNYT